MVPPEYRSVRPPKYALRGTHEIIDNGINIHIAERIVQGTSYLSSRYGLEFRVMDYEIKKRTKFQGEYSILGALISSQDKGKELFNDMVHRFFEAEVSIPNMSEQLGDHAYIPNLVKMTDEDLWLQIVHMRQTMPAINISLQFEKEIIETLEKDMNIILTDTEMPENYIDIMAAMNARQCMENLKREAFSIARAEGTNNVGIDHIKHARSNFKERFYQLINDERFKNITYMNQFNFDEMRKFVVENILRMLEYATPEEIYENCDHKHLFKDSEDIRILLEGQRILNKVIIDQNGRYRWI
jgi:hypothetical protein